MGKPETSLTASAILIFIICVANWSTYGHGAAAVASTAFVGTVTASGPNKYVAAMKLGTPPQLVKLTLHTEAQVTAISKSAFDYTKSSTYHSLLGDVFTDVLTINSTDGFVPTSAVQLRRISFKLEAGTKTQNVLALGGGPMAFPNQVSATGKVADKFAYCLAAGGSTSPTPIFFGNTSYYFDSGLPPSAGTRYPELDITPYLKYTPLIVSPPGKHGYGVEIVSIVVDPFNGGVAAEVNDIAAIGTESLYTSIVEPAYTQIRQAFLRTPAVMGSFPRVKVQHGPLDLCYNFTGNVGLLRAAPFMAFNLGGNASVLVSPENYLVEVGSTGGVYCFAVVSAGEGRRSSVIGTFQQQNNLVEFDLQEHRLGMTGSLLGLRSTCANFNFTASSSS